MWAFLVPRPTAAAPTRLTAGSRAGITNACKAYSARTASRVFGHAHCVARDLLNYRDMDFDLPPLPYACDALEPFIGREALALHHGAHHAGYLEKLSKLIGGHLKSGETLESLVISATGPVFENAAQAWNHDFLWRSMTPAPLGGRHPRGGLGDAIDVRFGSFAGFRREFLEVGRTHFGSGWLWLVVDEDLELRVLSTQDADLPLRHGQVPLLTCDLWEHAYYLDYRNAREQYLECFFDHLANWSFADANWSAGVVRR